jgi:hypothetical protein
MEPTKILAVVAVLSLVSVEYGGWALLTYREGTNKLRARILCFPRAREQQTTASLTRWARRMTPT